MPELPIVAEGENARGEHWYLKAGGSPTDYYTMLETLYPDGRCDEGGMGGAPLCTRGAVTTPTPVGQAADRCG